MKLGKELVNYVVFGVLTTIINLIIYALFTKVLGADYKLSITVAWLISMIFAFVTNKLYVFKKNDSRLTSLPKEFSLFFLIRLSSLCLDFILMIVLIQNVRMDDFLAKIIVNFIVIAVNYLASKYLVFMKRTSD
ncbi:GtrA family protein [Paenibacillus sp. EKM102P]|uniref:GtrA family protein n=1 Tax=Paenibacillus TaxID=44249 RepID=UPI000ACC4571|nr:MULTISPECIES: GtrA family protein [Paenibacillus]MEB4783697.1 GtrA family protein [Paenibacillus jamilae]KAF6621072.1 GtrA family protein [Paenibacillus sp. EKM101P]KAF6622376.1 GtrA family protein [Paenibacillus sp. EKM102P]KAF6632224.1 GtrA family protein [Paenibacillus sp. EKM10P]KAF6646980.1 GtrA family protein [Paenibacillus sp. EKM11P]